MLAGTLLGLFVKLLAYHNVANWRVSVASLKCSAKVTVTVL